MNQFTHYSDHQELEDHVRHFHKTNPFSDYLQEIVYGGSDGIVTTLAVISGFAGATGGSDNLQLTTTVVLLFAIANLLGDATSMGLGNFLSMRSENAVWQNQRKRQELEFDDNQDKSKQSAVYLLIKKGYSQNDAELLAAKMMQNRQHWLEFTLQEEVGIADSVNENSYISSLFTFLAFIVFGFLPVIPYLINNLEYQFLISVGFAIISLCLLGSVRKIVTGEQWTRSIGETLLVGGLSTSVAFVVGVFFGS